MSQKYYFMYEKKFLKVKLKFYIKFQWVYFELGVVRVNYFVGRNDVLL
jgi:hypothetical protein